MKPAKFDFAGARDLNAAKALLAEGDSKPVSGNQSLGPMLNLRLSRPGRLIDISRIAALREIRPVDGAVEIGAAVTHADIEDGVIADPTPGCLRAAAANIAYRAVRNRGTMGGSLAHADPAADWVIVTTGLGAEIIVDGPQVQRAIAMPDFMTGPFTTQMQDGELITAIRFATPGEGACWGYWKFMRQVGEFAKASAAIYADPERGVYRCAIGALGGTPVLLGDAKAIIDGDIPPADAIRAALPTRPFESLAMHATALSRALDQARSVSGTPS